MTPAARVQAAIELLDADALDLADIKDEGARHALREATPLWYYILSEAAQPDAAGKKGRHLGAVGGRIVADVLTSLLEGDPSSYINAWPPWTPSLPSAGEGTFTMGDLVRFVEEG